MEFQVGHLRAGDVIFVTGGTSGKSGRVSQALNVHGQRILAALRRQERIGLREELPRHSHVMLGLNSGNIIHADGRTVALEGIEQALHFGTGNAYEFSIFRRNGLDAATGERIAAEAIRYLHQKYDFKQYLHATRAAENENATQFCSRLVAMAYRLAGAAVTEMPDNRVLPVDLWRICQGEGWSEITGEFLSDFDWSALGGLLEPVDIPGRGPVDIATLMSESAKLLQEHAERDRLILEKRRETILDWMRTEALLGQYASAVLDKAKQARLNPSTIDDDFAAQICRVLKQLPALLSLGKLKDIKDVIEEFPPALDFNRDPSRGTFPGLPSYSEIAKLQINRETLRFLSYLLMAETGVSSVCAHVMDNEKFAAFRVTKEEFVKKFYEAVPLTEDFTPYTVDDTDFSWPSSKSDSDAAKRVARNVLACWQIVCLFKKPDEQSS